ncbi:MAG: AMP-binding protein [Sporichthyaceae bacterium]
MTFAAALAAQRTGELALRDPVRTWTWAEADFELRRRVNTLLAASWRPTRRLAIFAENSGETLLWYGAATLAGTSAVAVNFHLEPAEAAWILTHSQADVLIVDEATAARGRAAAELAGVGAMLSVADLADAPDHEPPTDHPPRPTLVYTSGTTGRPKGVELPRTSWVGGADVAEHVARLAQVPMVAHGRHLIVGPMYHAGPIAGTRLFLGGAPVTVLGRFDAEALLATVERDRIASAIVVPTHLQRVTALPAETRDRYDRSSLRYVLHVGAKFPEPAKRETIGWLGDVLWESYGASEVGTICTISAGEWLERPGSVGRPLPGFEAVVLDESDKPVDAGVEGRLFFRSTNGYGMHYVDNPEASVQGTDLWTLGEIGRMDEAGYIWITDRASDMIVSGGVNIYPSEAEQVLAAHPAVVEVACVGVPHPDLGEVLLALVVPAEPGVQAEALLAHCTSALTRYKCPRRIEFVDALARTPIGKLDKRAMRAPYWTA